MANIFELSTVDVLGSANPKINNFSSKIRFFSKIRFALFSENYFFRVTVKDIILIFVSVFLIKGRVISIDGFSFNFLLMNVWSAVQPKESF